MKSKEISKIAKRKTPVEKVIYIVVCAVFFVYSLSLLYPFVWGFFSSLKTTMEYIDNPFSFPKEWMFKNYLLAFQYLEYNGANMIEMLLNSVWFTFGGTLINVLVVSMAAYVVAKYAFHGRNVIYGISLFIMIVPIVGALPAQYRLYNQLQIINSPLLLLTYASGFGFNFVIMYSFFKSLPWSYAEAAMIDGAGHFQTYVKVMLPQAVTSLFAIGIIQAIAMWNDYMIPMLYLDKLPTLASGIYNYQTRMQNRSNFPVYYAGVLMSMVPIAAVYGIFHNVIMENTIAGGLKG